MHNGYGIYLSELISEKGLRGSSFKEGDIGLNLGLGVNINRWLLSLQYQIGFPSIVKGLEHGYVANRNFSLMLGYRILKPKKEKEPSNDEY